MPASRIGQIIKSTMNINVPTNICDYFIDFLPENFESMSDDELSILIQSDYLISEMVDDVDSINESIKEILDGESFRFEVHSCEYDHEENTYNLVIKNMENHTKYEVIYKKSDSDYKIINIETLI